MKRFSAPDLAIDMTPMIDCTFQLITFFMLVINFENTESDERIKLPESSLARPAVAKVEDELVLQVAVDRTEPQGPMETTILYSNENLPITQMEERMARERRIYRLKDPEGPIQTTIVIRADGDAPTGVIQELIRICQKQGYEKFVLKAKSKSE